MESNMKNMNIAITVDDGSRRVPIHNAQGEEIGSFTFHPTDIGIIDRFNRMAEGFDAITLPLEALAAGEDGKLPDLGDERLRGALAEAERRLRQAVNELFGSGDAAEAFFGCMHPFSPVNGEFYCAQVLRKVGEFIGRQFDTETKAMGKRVRKYLK